MERAADEAVGASNVQELKETVVGRAIAEGRSARRWMYGIPMVVMVFVMISLATNNETTVEDVRRGLALVAAVGGGGTLIVWLWWRWYRSRAVRAVSTGADGVRAWMAADARSSRRGAWLEIVSTVLFVAITGLLAAGAFESGSWIGGIVFGVLCVWAVLAWVVWGIGLIMARGDDEVGNGSAGRE